MADTEMTDAIRPEHSVPKIDYTITELDGVTYNTQERVHKGRL